MTDGQVEAALDAYERILAAVYIEDEREVMRTTKLLAMRAALFAALEPGEAEFEELEEEVEE